jgi:subtilisin family serine protease
MVDGSGRLKPQVSAPGESIRSTLPGGIYGFKKGTSMAAPHVAGLAALLISAEPDLSGQVDALENLITESAVPLFTTEGCGGDTLTSHPNHTYGWGRIDAWTAFSRINNDQYKVFLPIILKE